MPDIARILKADRPLTLAAVARGAQPLVLADLALAAKRRAVFVAPDEAAMRSVSDAARSAWWMMLCIVFLLLVWPFGG